MAKLGIINVELLFFSAPLLHLPNMMLVLQPVSYQGSMDLAISFMRVLVFRGEHEID